MTAVSKAALAARLAELGISGDELAAMIRVQATTVEAWLAGDTEPSPESRVLLRVLDHDIPAIAAAERVRHRFKSDLRGDGQRHAGVEDVPYGGGYSGPDAGAPR